MTNCIAGALLASSAIPAQHSQSNNPHPRHPADRQPQGRRRQQHAHRPLQIRCGVVAWRTDPPATPACPHASSFALPHPPGTAAPHHRHRDAPHAQAHHSTPLRPCRPPQRAATVTASAAAQVRTATMTARNTLATQAGGEQPLAAKATSFLDAFWKFLRPHTIRGTILGATAVTARALLENQLVRAATQHAHPHTIVRHS